MEMRVFRSVLLIFCFVGLLAGGTSAGPKKGSLIVAGGGTLGPDIATQFLELAGGPEATVVLIPTADGKETYDSTTPDNKFLKDAGFRHVIVLHTKDRKVADSKSFVEPIKHARGVWISGGRQWRLVDSYLNTRTQKELINLLNRGGVIGGSSAGASIQASYMVRGAREGNTIMMAKGYETGFGFLKNIAVDQHLLTRKREKDMLEVVKAHPELLGIGIDEKTAIVVRGNDFSVIGPSKVAIYVSGAEMYFLTAGDQFSLDRRKKL
jgi:cyanophycinase